MSIKEIIPLKCAELDELDEGGVAAHNAVSDFGEGSAAGDGGVAGYRSNPNPRGQLHCHSIQQKP